MGTIGDIMSLTENSKNKYVKPLKPYIIIFFVILMGLMTVTGVWAVTITPWFWAENVQNLAGFKDVRANASMVAKESDIAIAYAGIEGASGIYLKRNTEGYFYNDVLRLTTNQATRFPTLTIIGGVPMVAWSQSETPNPNDSQAQYLMQQDGHDTPQVLAGPIYGCVVPHMVESPTGLHIIYPASQSSFTWSQMDLYYAHRYFTETTWSTPTPVINHSQFIPPTAVGGKIWYPKMAVSPDGQILHIVWEQHVVYAGPIVNTTIWHLSGQWQSNGVSWNVGAAQQISPIGQNYAVRPNIAVAPSGKVHITWSETTGTTNRDPQYINYKQLGNTEIFIVSEDPFRVNSNSPTWASSAIALYEQDICVSWHGFYEGNTVEEITMRCSRDEGTTWQSLVNVSESQVYLSDFPAMAFDPNGYLHIAWEERELINSSYEPKGIYYRGGQPHHYQIYFPVVFRQG